MSDSPRNRERIGAIDVGSNSIRLVVAEYDPDTGFEIIDEVKDQPRLGTRVDVTGMLDRTAMMRAFAALKRMKEVADRRGVTRLAAVATSAVREARNGTTFAKRVRSAFRSRSSMPTARRSSRGGQWRITSGSKTPARWWQISAADPSN
jgi:exopolyphosphatase/pppGpp-phosphohydrolase